MLGVHGWGVNPSTALNQLATKRGTANQHSCFLSAWQQIGVEDPRIVTLSSLISPPRGFTSGTDTGALRNGGQGQAGCANSLQVMYLSMVGGNFNPNKCKQVLPAPTTFSVTLHRLVLAGDHKQLPTFVLSDEAKKLWPRSFLNDCVKKGVPTTQLAIQYCMYEELYAAANTVVYDDKVASAYKISKPSPLLSYLLDKLPEFAAGGKTYKVNSFSNFTNVDGKHQTIPNGSSCNSAEVDVIEGLVNQLKGNGKPKSSIAILTGYLW